jgi:hypothetical protein
MLGLLVENAVCLVYQRVYAPLRDKKLKKNFDVVKQLSPEDHYLMKKSIIRSALNALEEIF